MGQNRKKHKSISLHLGIIILDSGCTAFVPLHPALFFSTRKRSQSFSQHSRLAGAAISNSSWKHEKPSRLNVPKKTSTPFSTHIPRFHGLRMDSSLNVRKLVSSSQTRFSVLAKSRLAARRWRSSSSTFNRKRAFSSIRALSPSSTIESPDFEDFEGFFFWCRLFFPNKCSQDWRQNVCVCVVKF